MAKPEERLKAKELRRQGESIKVIAKQLGVSPGSVSRWCKNIKLTSQQIAKLERRARDPHYGRRLEYALEQQARRRQKIEKLKEEGIKETGKLTHRELFIAGVVLYWAEGFKKESMVGFANSDPNMINFFLRWLRESCSIPEEYIKLRIGLNISHKHRTKKVEKYWSKATSIPLRQFRRPFYQKVKWKKKYENPERYFGVLRVRVAKSTDFLRKIHGWIEGLKLNAVRSTP